MQKHSDEHRLLSARYANIYDKYGENETGNYMKYEEMVIDTAIQSLQSKRTAIDVGSGSGRCTLLLSSMFQNVVGMDFSPEMIEISKKAVTNKQNVTFIQRDVNEEGIELDSSQPVDFINLAFGMGSFIKDLGKLTAQIKKILSDSGMVHITFYNRNSLVYHVSTLKETDLFDVLAISAVPVHGFEKMRVKNPFIGDTGVTKSYFEIDCKYYTVSEIREAFISSFDIKEIRTFPTLSPLLQPRVMKIDEVAKFMRQFDYSLEGGNDGYYISVLFKHKNI